MPRFIEPEFADAFHVCTRKALKEPYKETCELKMRRGDGMVFWALLEVRGRYQNNEIRIAATDITERKKELKDDFISMVSHELRTPLTVIMGSIKVAQAEGITEEELKELLREADKGSEKMSHLLDNLIELSRYQSDRLKLNKERLNFERVIKDIIESGTSYLDGRKLALDIAPKLPLTEVDKDRLEQIIHNLLDNAAKYSPPNTEMRISVRHETEHILIGVSDCGKGISQEDQKKLFSPFERLHENSTTKPGLGLGLIVCKRLVEARMEEKSGLSPNQRLEQHAGLLYQFHRTAIQDLL